MTHEPLPFELDGTRYSICRPVEATELVVLLARAFSRHDPPAVASGLTEDDLATYLGFVTAAVSEDGLSIVSRDIASGEMAGALLTTTLHLIMLGVDERLAGRGIAQRLVEVCLANGAALGYRTAVTEATNRTSQHIFAKLGFVTRAEKTYADCRRDGVAMFESIADQGGIESMIRQPL